MSKQILRDLITRCPDFRKDFESGHVKHWLNASTPGGRGRKIDLLVGEADQTGDKPDLKRLRLCLENKSVVTAHRNWSVRYDDLNEVVSVLHSVSPEAIKVATIMVGVSERVLNVPDGIRPMYEKREAEFEKEVVPRLSSGDERLWKDFENAVSKNRTTDAKLTVQRFRTLPMRDPEAPGGPGYDFIYLVPVFIDNVNRPEVARTNALGLNVDADYDAMLEVICRAYYARWHV